MTDRTPITIDVALRKMHERETLEVRMQPVHKGRTRFILCHRSREFYKIGGSFRTFVLAEGRTMEEVVDFLAKELVEVDPILNQAALNKAVRGMVDRGLAITE